MNVLPCTHIEIGPCTTERQIGKTNTTFRVDLDQDKISAQFSDRTFSTGLIAKNLVKRQQKIIDGKIRANCGNLIGVNLMANSETQDSVPYLVHQDFTKGLKEFTELADYVTLNLTDDIDSNGLQ